MKNDTKAQTKAATKRKVAVGRRRKKGKGKEKKKEVCKLCETKNQNF